MEEVTWICEHFGKQTIEGLRLQKKITQFAAGLVITSKQRVLQKMRLRLLGQSRTNYARPYAKRKYSPANV